MSAACIHALLRGEDCVDADVGALLIAEFFGIARAFGRAYLTKK